MANSAWLVLAAMAFNLTRAVGVAAGGPHATTVTATIRTRLINVAARVTRSARRATKTEQATKGCPTAGRLRTSPTTG